MHFESQQASHDMQGLQKNCLHKFYPGARQSCTAWLAVVAVATDVLRAARSGRCGVHILAIADLSGVSAHTDAGTLFFTEYMVV